MKRKEAIELIEEGENQSVEFKRQFTSPEKIAREMMAFANTRGGYIFFGVDDNKEIIGVASEKGEAELIKEAAEQYCEPPLKYDIHFLDIFGKEVVIADIPESDNKPHRLQDYSKEFDITNAVVTIRVNDKSMQASKEMVRILKAKSEDLRLRKYSIGPVERMVFDYIERNGSISVKELSSAANISDRRASRTLVKLIRANLLMIHTKDNGDEFFTSIA